MLCYVYPISCRQDIEVSSEGPHPYGYSLWKNAKTRTENRSCGKWTGSLPWHYYQTLPPQALCHYPSARQIPFLLYCLMSSKKYCRQIAVLMTVRHSFRQYTLELGEKSVTRHCRLCWRSLSKPSGRSIYLLQFPFLWICGKITHFSYEKSEILHVFDVYYPKRGILTSYLTFVIYGIQKIKQSNALWCWIIQ